MHDMMNLEEELGGLMVSKFFEIKTVRDDFKSHVENIINELRGKKVIIYGAGDGFVELDKRYNFREIFNVVAIADRKFENFKSDIFNGFKAISPIEIPNINYDYIVVTNETNIKIVSYLKNSFNINDECIKTLFQTDISDEAENINYIESFNFSKNLEKLKKKIKNKTVLIYGSGVFFQVIKKYYNLDNINIIGIADKRFEAHEENETFIGYKVYSPLEIKELNPDYVLVATKKYIEIIENLYYETLAKTRIKIKPLVKKDLKTLIKEIWC